MTSKPVVETLKVALADTYALYLKTQNYHWNVTGPNFKPLHLLFEEQYNDLALAVDTIAERIRALGEKAPGTWKAYETLSTIKDGDENADAVTMVKEIAGDQDVLVSTLKQALEAAQTVGDEVTIGLVVDRMGVHEKAAWMLRSSV
jgi:starvation-inducible DNA-binding protein